MLRTASSDIHETDKNGVSPPTHIADVKLLPRFVFGFTPLKGSSVAFATNKHIVYGIGENLALHSLDSEKQGKKSLY